MSCNLLLINALNAGGVFNGKSLHRLENSLVGDQHATLNLTVFDSLIPGAGIAMPGLYNLFFLEAQSNTPGTVNMMLYEGDSHSIKTIDFL
mgnify:CR=1 FL=1